MKIEGNIRSTAYNDIPYGEVFLIGKTPFLKIKPYKTYGAVNLDTGDLVRFLPYEDEDKEFFVTPLHATLILKEE